MMTLWWAWTLLCLSMVFIGGVRILTPVKRVFPIALIMLGLRLVYLPLDTQPVVGHSVQYLEVFQGKIPTIGDTPADFRVDLLPESPNVEATIFHSKAVGEPPLMLAISVWSALRDAVASVADYAISPQLDTPATPERVLKAIMATQQEYRETLGGDPS